MKWLPESEPAIGQIRIRQIFAILPHKCIDGYVRWLEPIWMEEKYTTSFDWDSGWEVQGYFVYTEN
jgi:hypothetical protein